VQLFDQGWDHHSGIFGSIPNKARQLDRPVAALISDLKARGLLNETLVVIGAEFGRTPMLQGKSNGGAANNVGRDHHKEAYCMLFAGGGVRGGVSYGKTDELGYGAEENPVHIHDVNATILHQLGLRHEQLRFKYQGRHFRLTDVYGEIVRGILA
jgi:uncharacterized protein (DUF1501 family)